MMIIPLIKSSSCNSIFIISQLDFSVS